MEILDKIKSVLNEDVTDIMLQHGNELKEIVNKATNIGLLLRQNDEEEAERIFNTIIEPALEREDLGDEAMTIINNMDKYDKPDTRWLANQIWETMRYGEEPNLTGLVSTLSMISRKMKNTKV